MPPNSDEQAVLAAERRALDRWANGDPAGYVADYADDATYFDDIGAHHRVDGRAAIQAYFKRTLEGNVPQHRYELVDPKVQIYGDIGILTLRYHPFAPDGKPLTQWKATGVYRRDRGQQWRVVHMHWSMIKGT